MGWWGLSPAGTAGLQPLAGLLLSPDPAGPLLDASAPDSLPVPEGVASVPGRADSAVIQVTDTHMAMGWSLKHSTW